MIGLIGYAIACFFVAAVFTMAVALLRPIRKNDDILSWRVMAVMFVLAIFAPYGYVEIVTRTNGDSMESVVKDTALSLTGQSTFDYFKVLTVKENKARVIAVVVEKSKWGGMERAVIAMNLEKKDGKWAPVDFNWITSDQRSRDGLSLPPFW